MSTRSHFILSSFDACFGADAALLISLR